MFHSIHTLQPLFFSALFSDSVGNVNLVGCCKRLLAKNKGFDSTELAWLWAYGARTHFIHSGIRYFSFFTDAAIFGSTMGLSCTTFFLSALYSKNRYLKLFYFVVSMAGFYGLLIAGTRAAHCIPIAGLGVFLFLSKNWKIGMLSFLLLVGGVGMLKYTKNWRRQPVDTSYAHCLRLE